MLVNVLVNERVLPVSVQNGQQTFRWLAMVVQDRLKKEKNPFEKEAEKCLIQGFYNEGGELIDPRQKINEHAEWVNCTWQVNATTAEKFPADEWGNPIYSDWRAAAYLNSDNGFSWALEMDQWRQQVSSLQPEGSDTEAPVVDSNLIQIGEQPEAEVAFNLDWSMMKWRWLELDFTTDKKTTFPNMDKEIECIKQVLASRYELILVVFQHYCGTGEIGQRYGMSSLEFSHLLRLCGLVTTGKEVFEPGVVKENLPKNRESEEGGSRAGREEGSSHGHDEEAASAVFSEVAMASYGEGVLRKTNPAGPSAPVGAGGSIFEADSTADAKGVGAAPLDAFSVSLASMGTVSTANAALYSGMLVSRAHLATAFVQVAYERGYGASPSEALRSFLDDTLFPTWQQVCNTYALYQEYEDDSVFRTFFFETYYILKRQFFNYSNGAIIAQSRHDEQRNFLKAPPPSIDVDSMTQIFRGTLFAGSTMRDDEIEGEIARVFLGLQLSPRKEELEYREVVFSEFLEMIAGLALTAVDATRGLTQGKRLRMAFNYIIESSPGNHSIGTGKSRK